MRLLLLATFICAVSGYSEIVSGTVPPKQVVICNEVSALVPQMWCGLSPAVGEPTSTLSVAPTFAMFNVAAGSGSFTDMVWATNTDQTRSETPDECVLAGVYAPVRQLTNPLGAPGYTANSTGENSMTWNGVVLTDSPPSGWYVIYYNSGTYEGTSVDDATFLAWLSENCVSLGVNRFLAFVTEAGPMENRQVIIVTPRGTSALVNLLFSSSVGNVTPAWSYTRLRSFTLTETACQTSMVPPRPVLIESLTVVVLEEGDADISITFYGPSSQKCSLSLASASTESVTLISGPQVSNRWEGKFLGWNGGDDQVHASVCCSGSCGSMYGSLDDSDCKCSSGFSCWSCKHPVYAGLVYASIIIAAVALGVFLVGTGVGRAIIYWVVYGIVSLVKALLVIPTLVFCWVKKIFRMFGGKKSAAVGLAGVMVASPRGVRGEALGSMSSLPMTFNGCSEFQKSELIADSGRFSSLTTTPLTINAADVKACVVKDGAIVRCNVNYSLTLDLQTNPKTVSVFAVSNVNLGENVTGAYAISEASVKPVQFGMYYFGLEWAVPSVYLYNYVANFSTTVTSWVYDDGGNPPAGWWNCRDRFCNPQTYNCEASTWGETYANADPVTCARAKADNFFLYNGASMNGAFQWIDFTEMDNFQTPSGCAYLKYWYDTDPTNIVNVYDMRGPMVGTHKFASFATDGNSINFTCHSRALDDITPFRFSYGVTGVVGVTAVPESPVNTVGDGDFLHVSRGSLGTFSSSGWSAVVGDAAARGSADRNRAGWIQFLAQPTPAMTAIPRQPITSACSGDLADISCYQSLWSSKNLRTTYRPLDVFFSQTAGIRTFNVTWTNASNAPAIVYACPNWSPSQVPQPYFPGATYLGMTSNGPSFSASNSFAYPSLELSLLETTPTLAQISVVGNVWLEMSDSYPCPLFTSTPTVNGTVGGRLPSEACINVTSICGDGMVTLTLNGGNGPTTNCPVNAGENSTCCVNVQMSSTLGTVTFSAGVAGVSGASITSKAGAYNLSLDVATTSRDTTSAITTPYGQSGSSSSLDLKAPDTSFWHAFGSLGDTFEDGAVGLLLGVLFMIALIGGGLLISIMMIRFFVGRIVRAGSRTKKRA